MRFPNAVPAGFSPDFRLRRGGDDSSLAVSIFACFPGRSREPKLPRRFSPVSCAHAGKPSGADPARERIIAAA